MTWAAIAVVLDQVSKAVVVGRLAEGRLHAWAPGVGLRRCTNRSARLMALSRPMAVVLALVVGGSLVLVLAFGPGIPKAGAIGLGLVVGGAIGNLADRFLRGAVVDFIVIGRWPTFNLADGALVIGTGVAIGSLL